MTGLSWLMWITIFTTVALLTYGILAFYGNRRLVRERVKRASTSAIPLWQKEQESSFKKQFLDLISSFGKLAMKKKEDLSKLRLLLMHAGFRHPKGPAIYFGVRIICAVALPLPYLLANVMQGKMASGNLVMVILLSGAGFYLPVYLLNFFARRRQDRLDKSLPDVLDLLIVCMEAGLAMQAAINRVGDEVQAISRDLFQELQVTNAELRAGIPRETALRELGERTGVQNVKSLVGLIIQSEKMGVSIAQAMRTHAAFLRVQRAQQAEEKAAKLPVKILFPMLLFIFPAIFIVVLGPAVIEVTRSGLLK